MGCYPLHPVSNHTGVSLAPCDKAQRVGSPTVVESQILLNQKFLVYLAIEYTLGIIMAIPRFDLRPHLEIVLTFEKSSFQLNL